MLHSTCTKRRARRGAILHVALAAALVTVGLSARAANVSVSVGIGEPGYYGQINLGDAPPPQLIQPAPLVIAPDPRYAGPPLYLRVPPGYERHWARHCLQYNACGRPVYFVRDDWYRNVYAPHYQHRGESHESGREHARAEDERHERDHERR